MSAIEFENISKQYRLGLVSTRTLSHDLHRWWTVNILKREDPYLKIGSVNDRTKKADSEYVWALRDISFKVEEGEVLGIIGKNGAGKSTLLKILSKVTGPTTGVIRAKGRIGSLLEVGTGFHPEMTGRENIFMNGAILGMTKSEINSKLDEIIDFSGCERYIDTPVKRYSSGMMVRLGFAVAAHLEPEILVVDEVLAVGDAEFQKKAIGKMKDVSQGGGRTVLFVSHNMSSLQQLCHNGVVLENGMVRMQAPINEAIRFYQSEMVAYSSFEGEDGDPEVMQILSAKVEGLDGMVIYNSTTIQVSFCVKIVRSVKPLVLGFNVFGYFGQPLLRADFNDYTADDSLAPGVYDFVYQLPSHIFSPGRYKIVFDMAEKNVECYSTSKSNIGFDVIAHKDYPVNIYGERHSLKYSLLRNAKLIKKYKVE